MVRKALPAMFEVRPLAPSSTSVRASTMVTVALPDRVREILFKKTGRKAMPKKSTGGCRHNMCPLGFSSTSSVPSKALLDALGSSSQSLRVRPCCWDAAVSFNSIVAVASPDHDSVPRRRVLLFLEGLDDDDGDDDCDLLFFVMLLWFRSVVAAKAVAA